MTEAKEKKPDNLLQFRLSDQAALEELDKRANAEDVSRAKVAQELLTALLKDEFTQQVRVEIEGLRNETHGLRRDLEQALFLILLNFEVPEDAGDEEQAAHEERIRKLIGRALHR